MPVHTSLQAASQTATNLVSSEGSRCSSTHCRRQYLLFWWHHAPHPLGRLTLSIGRALASVSYKVRRVRRAVLHRRIYPTIASFGAISAVSSTPRLVATGPSPSPHPLIEQHAPILYRANAGALTPLRHVGSDVHNRALRPLNNTTCRIIANSIVRAKK